MQKWIHRKWNAKQAFGKSHRAEKTKSGVQSQPRELSVGTPEGLPRNKVKPETAIKIPAQITKH